MIVPTRWGRGWSRRLLRRCGGQGGRGGMPKQRVAKAGSPPSGRPAGAVEPEQWRRGRRFHISLTTPLGSAVTLARAFLRLELLEAG